MRKIIATILALGLLSVAACGNSNVVSDSCDQSGGVCVTSGACSGDTLAQYSCPSGGMCCSPPQAVTPTPAPTASAAADAGH
jgi:hypothetical protein